MSLVSVESRTTKQFFSDSRPGRELEKNYSKTGQKLFFFACRNLRILNSFGKVRNYLLNFGRSGQVFSNHT